MRIAEFCFCAPVTQASLEALLKASDQGRGVYRDSHPWLVAQRLWQEATGNQEQTVLVPLILAAQDTGELGYYAQILSIEVVALHRGQWESRCQFGPLKPMNPVWHALDSLMLWPASEQRERERLEHLRKHRSPLSAATLHPYAICETPEFIRLD